MYHDQIIKSKLQQINRRNTIFRYLFRLHCTWFVCRERTVWRSCPQSYHPRSNNFCFCLSCQKINTARRGWGGWGGGFQTFRLQKVSFTNQGSTNDRTSLAGGLNQLFRRIIFSILGHGKWYLKNCVSFSWPEEIIVKMQRFIQ